jgi:hypothetical protein
MFPMQLPRQHSLHDRLHQPLAVHMRALKSGFKLIAEGHELVEFGDDAAYIRLKLAL